MTDVRERLDKLAQWLEANSARFLWKTKAGRAQLEGYNIGGALVIVLRWPDGEGWDVFTSCPQLGIEETLRDADERLRAPSVLTAKNREALGVDNSATALIEAADALRDACIHAHENGASVELGAGQRVSTRIDAALTAYDRARRT